MEAKVVYIDPTTGLPVSPASAPTRPDPKIFSGWTGTEGWLRLPEEFFLKVQDTSYPYQLMLPGAMFNMIDGGPFVPSGILDGQEAILAVDVAALATELQVENYLTPDGRPIFEAGGKYLLMHRRPKDSELHTIFTSSEIEAEIITVSAAYDWTTDTGTGNNDGHFPTVSATTTARKRLAVVSKIVYPGASYDMVAAYAGYRYQREKPASITLTTAVDGGTQTIDITFTASTDKAVHGYMVQVLKKGDTLLCVDDVPVAMPEWVLPAEIAATETLYAKSDAAVLPVATVITLSAIDKYYSSATRTLAAITAGTYYVTVRALTQTIFDAELRMSDAVMSTVVVA